MGGGCKSRSDFAEGSNDVLHASGNVGMVYVVF